MTGHPATPAQATRYFLADGGEGAKKQLAQLSVSFGEAIPPERLRETWKKVAAAHAILRSSFRKAGATGLQRLEHDGCEAPWRELDWVDVPPAEIASRWSALLAEEAARPVDPGVAPPLRFVAIRLPGGSAHLLVTFPQFMVDEEAWFFFLCEWLEALEDRAAAPGETPACPDAPADAAAWWREYLAGPRPRPLRFFGAEPETTEQKTLLGREATSALAAAAQKAGCTTRDAILAAWGFLLARLNLTESAVLLASAEVPGASPGEGCGVNLLPARIPAPGDMSLEALAKAVGVAEIERAAHSAIALPELPQPEDFPSEPAGFPGAFRWLPPSLNDRIPDVFPRWINLDARLTEHPIHPLELEVRDGPRLSLRLRSSALPGREAARLLTWLEALLDAFVSAPDTRLGEIALPGTPTQADRDGGPALTPAPIQDIIADAAAAHPDIHAVEDESGAALSFREVDDYATTLAAHLRAKNLGDGWTAVVCLTPSPWVPVALVGVLRAGNTAVPLDSAASAGWLKEKAAAADAELVICDSGTVSSFEGTDKKVLVIDREWESLTGTTAETPAPSKPPKVALAFAGTPTEAAPPLTALGHSLLSSVCTRTIQAAGWQPETSVALTAPAGTAGYAIGILSALAAGCTARIMGDSPAALESASVWISSAAFAARAASLAAGVLPEPLPLTSLLIDTRFEPLSATALATWKTALDPACRIVAFHSPCDASGIALRFTPDEDSVGPVLPEGLPARGSGFEFADLHGQQPPFGYPGIARFHVPGTPSPCGDFTASRESSGTIFRERGEPPAFALCEAIRQVDGVTAAAWNPQKSETAWICGTADPSDPALREAALTTARLFGLPEFPRLFARASEIPLMHGQPDFHALERLASPPVALPPPPAVETPPEPAPEPPAPEPVAAQTTFPFGGDPDSPLLIIVGRGSSPSAFQPLSALMSDAWRVVCLPFSPTGSARSDAETIATTLASSFPEGPLHLVGIGEAGLPAFEAARKLRAQGRDIPYLVVAGAEPPKTKTTGWFDKIKRGLGAADQNPRPLPGPCGIVVTRDLPPTASNAWQDLAPDGVAESINCSTPDLTGPRVRDFAALLERLAG